MRGTFLWSGRGTDWRAELSSDWEGCLRQSTLLGTLRCPVASTTVRLCRLLLSSSTSLKTLSSLSLTELCPESFVMFELFRNSGCLVFVWTHTISVDFDAFKFSLSFSFICWSLRPLTPFDKADLGSLGSSKLFSMKSSWSDSIWHFLK
jgi:hypothetical protein